MLRESDVRRSAEKGALPHRRVGDVFLVDDSAPEVLLVLRELIDESLRKKGLA